MVRNSKGVTLIELIFVISLLSILLMVSILRGNYIINETERKELREFKNDINYARNRAIVESKLYSVDIRADNNTYLIFKYSSFPEVLKEKRFTSGIKIKSTNIKYDEVTFNYSGSPKESGTIYLENRKGEKISITITPATGKVNIYFQ